MCIFFKITLKVGMEETNNIVEEVTKHLMQIKMRHITKKNNERQNVASVHVKYSFERTSCTTKWQL